MKRPARVALITCLFIAAGCARSIELATDTQATANEILSQLDQARYAEAWENASRIFKDSVTQDDWLRIAREVREPHGQFIERAQRTASAKTNPINSPEGEYLLITYDSKFAEAVVVETLVLYLEDGTWRMAGYFLKDNS